MYENLLSLTAFAVSAVGTDILIALIAITAALLGITVYLLIKSNRLPQAQSSSALALGAKADAPEDVAVVAAIMAALTLALSEETEGKPEVKFIVRKIKKL